MFSIFMFIHSAYSACTNCWEEPNPDYDPTNPYETDPECITKAAVPCQVTGTPPNGQSGYSRQTVKIGPITKSDPSVGDYAWVTYSGTEIYGKWNQWVASDLASLSSNCEQPLVDNKMSPLLTMDLTVGISVGIPYKLIELGASLGHTWSISFGGTPSSIYLAGEDCTNHCASRWLIRKMACGDMNGTYNKKIYYGVGTTPIVMDWWGQDSNCTDEIDDPYYWTTSSAFCEP
ncbi:MAG: hypothetical protein LBN38_08205 [Verrucomicrobiota bacterium]|nr:hypothetical protein [Verrucomicrobiota bacterium]